MASVDSAVVLNKISGASSQVALNALESPKSSTIILELSPSQVSSFTRSDNDLILNLVSGESLTLSDFYPVDPAEGNELVLKDDEGALWLGNPDTQAELLSWELLTKESAEIGWWWAALGLGGAALAAGGSGGGGGGSSRADSDNEAPSISVDPIEFVNNVPIIKGQIDDPNATITVQIGDKTYTAINNGDGTWSLPSDAIDPLPDGPHKIIVTATDSSGNSKVVEVDVVAGPTPANDVLGPDDVPVVTIPGAEDGITAQELQQGLKAEVELTPNTSVGDTITLTLKNDQGVEVEIKHVVTEEDLEDGTVAIELPKTLPEGKYEAVAVIDDGKGNQSSPSAPLVFDIDLGVDSDKDGNTLTIDSFADDTGASDGITSDNTLVFKGTVDKDDLDAGRTLSVTVGGQTYVLGEDSELTLQGTPNTQGVVEWVLDLSGRVLADSTYTVEAKLTAPEGGFTQANLAVTVDTVAPQSPTAALENDTGTAGDGVTSDPTVIVGGLEPGSTWQYSVDGGETWLNGTGTSFDLDEDSYIQDQVQVRQVDLAGNPSDPHKFGPIQIDKTPPQALGAQINDTGAPNDGLTSDPTLTITNLEPGATWEYSTDSGQTWKPGTGTSVDLPQGSYINDEIQVRQTDAAGNLGPVTKLPAITIDTTNPGGDNGLDAPTLSISNLEDDILDAAEIAAGVMATVGLTEGSDVGDVVTLVLSPDGGQPVVLTHTLVEADLDRGTVEIPLGSTFFEGNYTAVATITDAAGNTSADSSPLNFAVDLGVDFDGDGHTLTFTLDGLDQDTNIPDDGITYDDELIFKGTIDPDDLTSDHTFSITVAGQTYTLGSSPQLMIGNTPDADGMVTWTLDLQADPVAEGTHEAIAELTHTSGASVRKQISFTVDKTPPATPTVAINDTGDSTDGVTQDGVVTVGNLEPGATWEYSLDNGGSWINGAGTSFTLAEGTYPAGSVQVRQKDVAGNISMPETLQEIIVDTTSPGSTDGTDAPLLVISNLEDGILDADEIAAGITATVELTQGSAADDVVTIVLTPEGGTPQEISYVLTPADILAGEVVIPLGNDFVQGDYTAVATITDLAGNSSAPSAPPVSFTVELGVDSDDDGQTLTFTIDGILDDPYVPGDGLTSDNTLIFKGTVDQDDLTAGRTLTVTVAGTTYTFGSSPELTLGATVGADNMVEWILDLQGQALPDGDYTATAKLSAAGGAAVQKDVTFTVDTVKPNVPDTTFNDTGDSTDGITGDANITVSNLEPDATWEYSLNAGVDWIPGNGNSFTLPDGSYSADDIQVRQTDAAGNISDAAKLPALTVDTAVSKPELSFNDSGVAGDNLTNDPSITVDGLEPDSTWYFSIDNGQNWQQGTGTSFTLPEGTYTEGQVQVYQVDQAGNTSAKESLPALTIDLTATAPTLTVPVASDDWVNIVENDDGISVEFALPSDAKAGDVITLNLEVGGVSTPHTYTLLPADIANQAATLTLDALDEGVYQLTATLTDDAGNISTPSAPVTFEVDLSAPAPLDVSLNTPPANGSLSTTDNQVNVDTRNLEPNASWQYTLDGGQLWLDGTGTRFDLDDGEYTADQIGVRQVDEAGNPSQAVFITDGFVIDESSPANNDGQGRPTLSIPDAADGWVNAAEVEPDGVRVQVALTQGTRPGDTIVISMSSPTLSNIPDVTYVVTPADYGRGTAIVVIDTPVDGEYTFSSYIRDQYSSSLTSTPVTVKIDTTLPDALTVDAPNSTLIDGQIVSDGEVQVTDIEPNATWEYSLDGGDTWLTSPSTTFTLPQGSYGPDDIVFRQIDEAGNESLPASLGAIVVDTSHPGGPLETDQPTLSVPEANDGWVNKADADDGVQVYVGLTPGARAGDVIKLTVTTPDGETVIEHVITPAERDADESLVTIQGPLVNGMWVLKAQIVDPILNQESAISANQIFSVDTIAPSAPTASFQGAINNFTNNDQVLVSGIETDATWQYQINNGSWITGTGNSFTLNPGSYPAGSIVVKQIDKAGNESPITSLGPITVDTTNPSGPSGTDKPTIEVLDVVDGYINADDLADGVQVKVTLTPGTSAGDTITLTVAGSSTQPYTVTVADKSANTAIVTIPKAVFVPDGSYTVTASIKDRTGDTATSDPETFNVDATVATPELSLVTDTFETIGTDADGITYDGEVTVSGLEVGGTFSYRLNGGAWSTSEPITSGTMSFTLPNGSYPLGSIEVRQEDARGNISAIATLPKTVVVDTLVPDTPTSLELSSENPGWINSQDDSEGVSLIVKLPATAQEADHILVSFTTGSGEDFTYAITAADIQRGEALVPLSGKFAVDGTYTLSVSLEDLAGNVSPSPATTITFTVDRELPGELNADYVDLGEAGYATSGIIQITPASPDDTEYEDERTVWEYSTNGGVSWNVLNHPEDSFEVPDGTYEEGTILVRQVDAAGNRSPQTSLPAMTVDSVGPDGENQDQQPTLMIPDVVDGWLNEAEFSDGIEFRVQLTPATEVGDKVVVTFTSPTDPSIEITQEFEVTAADLQVGNVGRTLNIDSTDMPDGNYSATAVIKDPAGNTAQADPINFTKDTVVSEELFGVQIPALDQPVAGDNTVSESEIGNGSLNTVDVSFDNTDIQAGDTITISAVKDGQVIYTVEHILTPENIEDGYSHEVFNTLPPGQYSIDVVVSDEAGNEQSISVPDVLVQRDVDIDNDQFSVSIDSITVDTGVAGDFITNSTDVITITGRVDANDVQPTSGAKAVLYITVGTGPTIQIDPATLTADPDDPDKLIWEATLPAGTNPGTYTVVAEVRLMTDDGSGGLINVPNVQPVSVSKDVVIDRVIDTAHTLQLAMDTGISSSDGYTSNGRVTINGLEEGSSWTYRIGSGEFLTPIPWTPDSGASFVLNPGVYAAGDIVVRQIDRVGNTLDVSMGAVTVDQTPPAPVTINYLDDTFAGDGVLNGQELTAAGSSIDVEFVLGTDLVEGDRLAWSYAGGAVSYITLDQADITAGKVSLTLPMITEGQVIDLRVTVIDKADNRSPEASGTLSIDTSGPADSAIVVGFDEEFADYINADEQGRVSITGEFIPGVTVESITITDSLGATITVPIAGINASPFTLDDIDVSTLADGPLTLTMTVIDAEGNTSTRADTTELLTEFVVEITDITGFSPDPVNAGDYITSASDLVISGTVVGQPEELSVIINEGEPDEQVYTLSSSPAIVLNGNEWSLDLSGEAFESGQYSITVTGSDVAGNTSTQNFNLSVLDLVAVDNDESLDLSGLSVDVHDTTYAENTVVLGLLEASSGADAAASFTVGAGNQGSVVINVSQTALASVADAFAVDIYNDQGVLVYTAVTPDSTLIGSVAGVGLLNLTGTDGLTAVVHGLPEGNYYVIVRNDQSRMESLLGNEDGSLLLAELGANGMVLGPNNKAVLLNEIELALNGSLTQNGSSLGLGTIVKGVLNTALTAVDVLPVGDLIGLLQGSGLIVATGFLDQIIDVIAEVLLSNFLMVFQFTDVDLTLTEYNFGSTGNEVTGNLITDPHPTDGADSAPAGSLITYIKTPDGPPINVPATGQATVYGQYGVLTISSDGAYQYHAYGLAAGSGQTETFTYVLAAPGGKTAEADLNITLDGISYQANDDTASIDLGDVYAQVQEPISVQELQVLGIAEGVGSEAAALAFSIGDDNRGDVQIQVRQSSLLAIADAIRIDILDVNGNVVWSAVSADNPLLGNVLGLNVLGVVGNDGIVANVQGLPEGDYRVVVRKDASAIDRLVDQLSLAELGERGVLLGPDNQEVILDAVDQAVGPALALGIRPTLTTALGLLGEAQLGLVVGILTDVLNSPDLVELVDEVLDSVARALLSNVFTAFQTTEVTAQVTEYQYQGNFETAGNLITGTGAGAGADEMPAGSVITYITDAYGRNIKVIGEGSVTVQGKYGVLIIDEEGEYEYLANGARNGIGFKEEFSYTVTGGDFDSQGNRVTDTATLSIAIDGTRFITAGVEFEPDVDAFTMPASFTKQWSLFNPLSLLTPQSEASDSFVVNEDTLVDIQATLSVSNVAANGTRVFLQKEVNGSWTADREIDAATLLSLGSSSGTFSINDIAPGTYRFVVQASGVAIGSANFTLSYTATQTLLNELVVAQSAITAGQLQDTMAIRDDGAGGYLAYSIEARDPISGSYQAVTDGTVLQGRYGALTINADGSYSYQADANLQPSDLIDPEPEVFEYQFVYADSIVEQASIMVVVTPTGYERIAVSLVDSSLVLLEAGVDAWEDYSILDLSDPITDPDKLVLKAEDVLKLDLAENGLLIEGDSDDIVDLTQDAWAEGVAGMNIGGQIYDQYTLQNLEIWVSTAVTVEGF